MLRNQSLNDEERGEHWKAIFFKRKWRFQEAAFSLVVELRRTSIRLSLEICNCPLKWYLAHLLCHYYCLRLVRSKKEIAFIVLPLTVAHHQAQVWMWPRNTCFTSQLFETSVSVPGSDSHFYSCLTLHTLCLCDTQESVCDCFSFFLSRRLLASDNNTAWDSLASASQPVYLMI